MMLRKFRDGRRGQALVEFTFVGIPIIFILVSVFEISRGMWNYHTLAYAAKAGVRYAVVHGKNCGAPTANNCLITIAQITQVIRDAGVGLDLNGTTVTFNTLDSLGTVNGTVGPCTLTACAGNTTQWPPDNGSNVKGSLIRIEVRTVFRSAIAMLWPGSRPVSFAVTNMAAGSTDTMQF